MTEVYQKINKLNVCAHNNITSVMKYIDIKSDTRYNVDVTCKNVSAATGRCNGKFQLITAL